jgi:manganese/zinc/iron transport system permease protein
VLCASAVVLVSLLFAPGRGLVRRSVHASRSRQRLRTDAVLVDLFELSRQHESIDHPHPVAVLKTVAVEPGAVEAALERLEGRGLARSVDGGWVVTEAGRDHALRLESQEVPR